MPADRAILANSRLSSGSAPGRLRKRLLSDHCAREILNFSLVSAARLFGSEATNVSAPSAAVDLSRERRVRAGGGVMGGSGCSERRALGKTDSCPHARERDTDNAMRALLPAF